MPATSERTPRPGFVGGAIDRADPIRCDPERLAVAWTNPRARQLVLDGLDPVLRADDSLATCAISPDAMLAEHALLGLLDGEPLFVSLASRAVPHGADYAPRAWSAATVLDEASLAHYGMARSLVDWHARHGFCAQCGALTIIAKAGWSRICPGCAAEHFPRVDPVVIMLAEHGGRVLIGRQARYPQGRYSALAGFVEPGETIEEAVARELFEEAGVRVRQIEYVMSQPWPFPSSLMIACIAQARDDALVLDERELVHAFWADRAGVAAALAGRSDAPFLAPPPMAIAHHLLHHWLG